MTIFASDLATEVGRELGDPLLTRIAQADLIQWYNDALEYITTRYRTLEQDASFTIVGGADSYFYPDDMVAMKRLRASSTPSDPLSYRAVDEMFEDDIRRREFVAIPQGDCPFA